MLPVNDKSKSDTFKNQNTDLKPPNNKIPTQQHQNIAYTDTPIYTDTLINDRKVIKQTSTTENSTYILIHLEKIISNKLLDFNLLLNDIMINLNNKLNFTIRFLITPKEVKIDLIDNAISILCKMLNSTTHVEKIIAQHILVDKNINDLLKNTSIKPETDKKIFFLVSIHQIFKQSLTTMFNQLTVAIKKSINIIESQENKSYIKYDILLRQLFNVTDIFNKNLQQASIENKLNALQQSYNHKIATNTEDTNSCLFNAAFLEQTEHQMYDILSDIVTKILLLSRSIDGMHNLSFS